VLPPIEDLEERVAEMFVRWRVPPGDKVTVTWNSRLRSTAGRAFYRDGRIELNPELLERSPDHVDTVLVHEAAHVAAHRLFGAHCPAHGRHWRGLMRLAGLPPDVTHSLPVPRKARSSRRERIYLRVCDACGDRRIARTVRYDECRCGARNRFLVLRAPATSGGLDALRNIALAEVRERCAINRAAP
jgi:predicted SprT family Zn-dependent metalloprotease